MTSDRPFPWYKTHADNEWHPQPGAETARYPVNLNLPTWLRRMDIEAASVDIAPFVAGAGGLAHMRQLNSLGWTAPASVFRNVKTMTAMHRAVLYLTPLVLLCQAAGWDYRRFIPRWNHERERRRDEAEVRQQIDAGMGFGAGVWVVRMYFLSVAKAYWAPMDIVMGGALADLLHREYVKAHGL